MLGATTVIAKIILFTCYLPKVQSVISVLKLFSLLAQQVAQALAE